MVFVIARFGNVRKLSIMHPQTAVQKKSNQRDFIKRSLEYFDKCDLLNDSLTTYRAEDDINII
jgi:hypothetical protein